MIPAGVQSHKLSLNPVAIAVLFHLSGAIGILLGYSDWFVALTPLNLIIMFILLVTSVPQLNRKWLFFFILCYGTGFLSEMIGVNTGMLFGNYHYGIALGPKISGVPLLIAVNWFMVVYGAGHSISFLLEKTRLRLNLLLKILLGAVLCTLFDWIMEPAAIKLGYWNWTDTRIPIFNYITWFVLSALLLFAFEKFDFKKHPFAMYLLLIQSLFFGVLR